MFWPDSHKKVALRIRDVSGQWMTASEPFLLTSIGSIALATSADHEVGRGVGWVWLYSEWVWSAVGDKALM